MTDGQALLRAIIDHPDDDTLRLIYADWLDENDQPDRAAFIRLQIEAARAEPYSPQARSASLSASRLLNRHRGPWTKHLTIRLIDYEFSRGFIERISIDAARFPKVAEALFKTEPIHTIRIVRFATTSGRVSLLPLFDVPQLRQLHGPRVADPYPYRPTNARPWRTASTWRPSGLFRFATTRYRRSGSPISYPVLASRISRASTWEKTPISARPYWRGRGMPLIAGSAGWIFQACICRSGELQRLLAAKCLEQVEELNLTWPGTLAGPGPLPQLDIGWVLPWNRLRALDLTGQNVGPGGAREIARQPGAASCVAQPGLQHAR